MRTLLIVFAVLVSVFYLGGQALHQERVDAADRLDQAEREINSLEDEIQYLNEQLQELEYLND